MLSKKEYEDLVSQVQSTKCKTAAKVLTLLEKSFVKTDPMLDAYADTKKNCVNPTRKSSPTETAQSKFEKKNAVKVFTQGDSERADALAGKPSVRE